MPQSPHSLLHPHSIAVVGASDRTGSTGRSVFSQLAALDAAPLLVPVNPARKTVGGREAYAYLAEAAAAYPIDTAVLIVAAEKLAGQIREAAKCGVRNLIVVNETVQPPPSLRNSLERAVRAAAAAGIRLLPVTASGIGGLFQAALPHTCAYIGQGADIADCMAAYAEEHGVSFNRFTVLNPLPGASGCAALIDHAAADEGVKSLLVHIGSAQSPRELVSALAAAARRKPVIVLPTLSDPQQQALLLQALSRSRILHVPTLTGFFTAAKLLDTGIQSRGPRLAVVSNAAQIGALTLNALAGSALTAAEPSAATVRALSRLLPGKTERHHPAYLPADAAPLAIQAAVEQHLHDEANDAVLLVYAGSDKRDSVLTAELVSALQKRHDKPLLLVWMGRSNSEGVRQIFNRGKNLHFKQSEYALHAMEQLNQYREYRRSQSEDAPPHDYARAARAAAALSEHIRPLLPVAVLPAGRTAAARLLEALGIPQKPAQTLSGSLNISWETQPPFGRVLTLSRNGKSTSLLPPVSSDIAARALQELDWPAQTVLPLLLDAAEIFARSPEIHSCQLTLQHNGNGAPFAAEVRLNLQEAGKQDAGGNLYAPYPHHAEQSIALPGGGSALIRPIRPEDAALLADFFAGQSRESRQSRFMSSNAQVPPQLLSRLSRIDYGRDFGLIVHDAANRPLATANYISDAGGKSCEFGISIADELQGRGIGTVLMQALIAHARGQGMAAIRADILADNLPMRKLAEKLGFTLSPHPDDAGMVEARLELPPPESPPAPAGLSESIKARLRKQIGRP